MSFSRLSIFYFFILSTACKNDDGSKGIYNQTDDSVPVINYAVTKTYPNDTTSFTEGLLVHDDKIYESTGSPDDMPQTKSLFGPVDTTTGMIIKKVEIDRKYFGEGICFLEGKVLFMMQKNLPNSGNLTCR